MSQASTTVFVEAPGRLHMGVLDLRGSLGRRFGGLGAAAPVPPLLVSACCSGGEEVVAVGADAERAADFARRTLAHHAIQCGLRVEVHRSLPRHAGLGSGTQLALAVARAIAELLELDTSVQSLAHAVGRTRRSGVGMWVFDDGGLVVEGGRRTGHGAAPLLARLPFPSSWRCVVVIPDGAGMSGRTEEAAFEAIPAPAAGDVERVAHHVLMGLLPALAERDLPAFGTALAQIQRITGDWFATVQGGTFSTASQPIIERLTSLGVHGVGQSSWGPTVFGIVDGDETAQAVIDEVALGITDGGSVFAGPFRTGGARVWRA